METKIWLADHFGTGPEDFECIMKNSKATEFLYVWPVMEQTVFRGFMKESKIPFGVGKLCQYFGEMAELNNIAKMFHERYQNEVRLDDLRPKEHTDEFFETLIRKPYDRVNERGRLYILFYVTYRIRNNIFHGSKQAVFYLQDSPLMDACIVFMRLIVDCWKRKKLERKRYNIAYRIEDYLSE